VEETNTLVGPSPGSGQQLQTAAHHHHHLKWPLSSSAKPWVQALAQGSHFTLPIMVDETTSPAGNNQAAFLLQVY
jgi:hypothetical protein